MGWGSEGETRRKCPTCHKGPLTRMGGNWSGEFGADTYRFDCQNLKCRRIWETEHGSFLCRGTLRRAGKWLPSRWEEK